MNAGDVVLQETVRPAVSTLSGPRRFYVWLSAACLALAVVGFVPTYWLQLAPGTFDGPPLVHLHAWLFSAWPCYFLVQSMLAAKGRVARHRAWGLLGASLATAMVIVGTAVANDVLVTRLEDGHGDRARAFHIVSMSMMVLFAAFVAAALAYVSRPEVHKRLMILATITILPPAMARLFFAVTVGIGPGLRPSGGPPRTVEGVFTSALAADLLILAAIVYDVRARRPPSSCVCHRRRDHRRGADSSRPVEHDRVVVFGSGFSRSRRVIGPRFLCLRSRSVLSPLAHDHSATAVTSSPKKKLASRMTARYPACGDHECDGHRHGESRHHLKHARVAKHRHDQPRGNRVKRRP